MFGSDDVSQIKYKILMKKRNIEYLKLEIEKNTRNQEILDYRKIQKKYEDEAYKAEIEEIKKSIYSKTILLQKLKEQREKLNISVANRSNRLSEILKYVEILKNVKKKYSNVDEKYIKYTQSQGIDTSY